jgi:hypothetical protein
LRVSLFFVSLCGENSYQSDTLEESSAQMERALTALGGGDDNLVRKKQNGKSHFGQFDLGAEQNIICGSSRVCMS